MKIRKTMAIEEFPAYVEAIQSCGDHPIANLTPEVIASAVEVVDAYIEEKDDWEDTKSYILVRLASGEYGVFQEWSDSSGHG